MKLSSSAEGLLNAFDQVGNSNSHLLQGKACGDVRQSFLSFIENGDFHRELLSSDLVRDWFNFHQIGPDGLTVALEIMTSDLSDLKVQTCFPVSVFREELFELLHTGKSFHDKRLPSETSRDLVNSFVSAHCPQETAGDVLSFQPDFLFQVRRDGGEESVQPYFEDRGWDRCWAWLFGDRLLVLLLNGAP